MDPKSALIGRLPRALLLTAVAALVLGGTTGFATAAGDETEVLGIAAPRGGDRAIYRIESAGLEEDLEGSIEVLPVGPLRLLDGTGVSAYSAIGARTSGQISDSDFSMRFASADTAALDPATGRVVSATTAQAFGFHGTLPSSFGPTENLTGGTRVQGTSLEGERREDLFAQPPCGSVSSLQREPAALGDRIEVPGCAFGGFRVVSIGEMDGVTTLIAQSIVDDGVRVWFQAGVPYPVKMAFHQATTWTLTGFAPGEHELVPGEPAVSVVLPEVTDGPAGRLGPDDSGFAVTFPLKDAWAAAEAGSQRLRDFEEAHPDWFLEAARYSEEAQGETIRPVWDLDVRGGAEALVVRVTPSQDTFEPVLRDVLGPTGLYSQDTSNVVVNDGLGIEVAWPDVCFQDRMPTVASVAARWSALEEPAEPANAWAFQRHCFNEVIRTVVYAGDARTEVPEDSTTDLLPTQSSASTSQETLTLLGAGTDGSFVERVTVEEQSTQTWGPLQPPPKPASADPVTVARSGAWAPPTAPVAAGLTLLSLLAGAVYWLWPTLKLGPLALFSRLRTPDLLQHPVRSELVQRIEAQPGIHYQDLVRAVGKGKGAVEHHLRKLTEGGLVKSLATGGYTCYFPVAFDRRLAAATPALKSDGARALMAAVQASPGASAGTLAIATGLSPAAVSHHLQRLGAAGLVDVTRNGRSVAVQATALANEVAAAGA